MLITTAFHQCGEEKCIFLKNFSPKLLTNRFFVVSLHPKCNLKQKQPLLMRAAEVAEAKGPASSRRDRCEGPAPHSQALTPAALPDIRLSNTSPPRHLPPPNSPPPAALTLTLPPPPCFEQDPHRPPATSIIDILEQHTYERHAGAKWNRLTHPTLCHRLRVQEKGLTTLRKRCP